MPPARRTTSVPPDRALLPRTLGLPPGWEHLPAWERGEPLTPPPVPEFDRAATLRLLSARLRHGWVRDPGEIILPVRMGQREAWFWLNLTATGNFEKFQALELDHSPEPETVREFLRARSHLSFWPGTPQMLLAFFTVEETVELLFGIQLKSFLSAREPIVGLAMFLTPYLDEERRASLIARYVGLLSPSPSLSDERDRGALNILAALGHTELFTDLIQPGAIPGSITRTTMLFFSALPDRETFLRLTAPVPMEYTTDPLVQRWWLACVRHHAPERLFPWGDVYRLVAPEVAPVMLGWLGKKGAGAPAAAWLKRNFPVAVAGLAPLLVNASPSANAGDWFTLQWEQNPAGLEAALAMLTEAERCQILSLRPFPAKPRSPANDPASTSYPPEFSPWTRAPMKGWNKPPAWLTVSRLTIPGFPAAADFLPMVLHHLTGPEQNSADFQRVLMECLPAGGLERLCREMTRQWNELQQPKAGNWVRMVTARMGGLSGLHELACIDFDRSTAFSRQTLILDALSQSGHPASGVFLWLIHQTCKTPAAREKARALTLSIAEAGGLTLSDFLDLRFPVTGPHDPSSPAGKTPSLTGALHQHLVLRFQEEMLSRQRRTVSLMRGDLLTKPLARQVMRQLVWGRFASSGKLLSTFRIDEEGGCVDVRDLPVRFGPDEWTGAVHPVDLSAEEVRLWQDVLHDYQIVQPFVQMHRQVLRAGEKEMDQTTLTRFKSQASTEFLICSTFYGALWEHDKPQETGQFTRFFRTFDFAETSVCVRHDPILEPWLSESEGWEECFRAEVAIHIHEVFFVKSSVPKKAWRVPANRLPVREVDPLILSEALWLGHQASGLPMP